MSQHRAIPTGAALREVMFVAIENKPGKYKFRFWDGCKNKELSAVNGPTNLHTHLKGIFFSTSPIFLTLLTTFIFSGKSREGYLDKYYEEIDRLRSESANSDSQSPSSIVSFITPKYDAKSLNVMHGWIGQFPRSES